MKVVVGTRDLQLVEKDLRHVVVIVLPCVDDDFLYLVGVMVLDSATQRSGLDDLGSGPDDGDKFHGLFGVSEGHFSVVTETIIAFVANDDMVGYLDVQEFAASHELFGQQSVVLAGPWVARRMVVTQYDACGVEVQGVFEDDFRVGDDMGGAAVADAFHL